MTIGHAARAGTGSAVAQRQGVAAPSPPAQQGSTTIPTGPGGPKVTVGQDGKMTVVAPDGSTTILDSDGRVTHVDAEGNVSQSSGAPLMDDRMPDGALVSIIGVHLVLAFLLGRWWTSRKFRKRGAGQTPLAVGVPADLGDRIDRIEHAIESVSIEVERISEGQRFTTKLMSEMRPAAGQVGAGAPAEVSAPPRREGAAVPAGDRRS